MPAEHTVRAIVIPRRHHTAERLLSLCVAFRLRRPPPGAPPAAPPIFSDWPAWVDGALRRATVVFEGGAGPVALPFQRRAPHDLAHAGWRPADATAAWKLVFGRAAAERGRDAARPASALAGLYAAETRPEVNPDVASDLNPAHRFESVRQKPVAAGMMAAQFRRTRDAGPPDLDDRVLAALDPVELDRAVVALARAVEEQPGRFAPDALAGCRALVGHVAAGGPAPREVLAGWPVARRRAVARELVNVVADAREAAARPEVDRVDRLLDPAAGQGEYQKAEVEKQVKEPTFAELVARVSQYPGLARRLGLVVHGVVAVPADAALPDDGLVHLALDPAEAAYFPGPPTRTRYRLAGRVFRPAVGSRAFAPDPDLFYAGHLLDPALYDVTQDDYMVLAARAAARVNEADVADARPAGAAELAQRYRVNSVQFLSTPRAEAAAEEVSVADAADRRLRAVVATEAGNRPLTAEDLMAGVTVFVRPKGSGAGYGWRSLCRRVVRLSPRGGRPLAVFEEEGYVATGTSVLPPPVAGVLSGTAERGTDGRVTEVRINRLHLNNVVDPVAKPYPADTTPGAEPVAFRGNFRGVVTEADLEPGDVVRLSLGVRKADGSRLSEVLIVPLLTPAEIGVYGGDAVVTAAGISDRRRAQKFAVLLTDRTGFLDERGKKIDPKEVQEEGKYDPGKLRKMFEKFFVEGESRLMANGPSYPRTNPQTPAFFRALAAPAKYASAAGEAVLVHPAVPPGVLREYHLDPAHDWVRDVPLPRAAAPGENPSGDLTTAELVTVREVTTPLAHVRGRVVRTEFEMTAVFRPAGEALPTRAFVTVRGAVWELAAEAVPVAPGFPRVFPKIIPDQADARIDPVADPVGFGRAELTAALAMPTATVPHAELAAVIRARRLAGPHMEVDAGGVALAVSPALADALVDPGEAPAQLWVRFVGEVEAGVTAAGVRAVTLRVTAAARVGVRPVVPGDDPFRFAWRVHVRDNQQPPVVVWYDAPKPSTLPGPYYPAALADRRELLHPVDAVGLLVGVVTGMGAAGPATGRGWPQAIPGTLGRRPSPEAVTAAAGSAAATIVPPAAVTPGRWEFATLDGLRLTNLAPPDGTPVPRSGYFFLTGEAEGPGGGQAVVRPAGEPTSFLVAGEVTEVGPGAGDERRLTVVTLALPGGRATVGLALDGELSGLEFLPLRSAAGPRPLRDLRRGEFVLVRGRADLGPPGGFTPGRLSPVVLKANRADVAAVVRGRLVPQPTGPAELLRDGSARRRVVVRSPSGAEVLLYADRDTVPAGSDELVAVANPLIVAATVSRWKQDPMAAAPAKAGAPEDPVHALASELLARWSGWALTTRMPGAADDGDAPRDDGAPFTIACDREAAGVALVPGAGRWAMPPLRFGAEYEFCLRRVDLAGNHVYDESPPPHDLPPTAVRRLTGLLDGDVFAAALGAAAAGGVRKFDRTDPPFEAALAFPPDRPKAVWDPTPPGPVPPDFALVAHAREPLLALFSDVLGRGPRFDREAAGALLPPAAAVETVLMHGALDDLDPVRIPEVIRCHERYLPDLPLGVDRHGRLNYFGDPQVRNLRVTFVTDRVREVVRGRMPGASPGEAAPVFGPWPCPCPVWVLVAPGARDAGFARPADLAPACRVKPGGSKGVVELWMPPGGAGYAAVVPVVGGEPFDVGQRVRVLHVTNGAWVAPKWADLRAEPAAGTGQAPHRLRGAFDADVATTEAYTLSGYWNECWDEALSLGWEEARVAVRAEGGVVTGVEVPAAKPDRGYGYGTEAVAVVAPRAGAAEPGKLPVLAPVVEGGRLVRVDVLNGGTGFDPEAHEVRVIRRPPLFAVARAEVTRPRGAGGPLLADEIRVTDEGGWYTRPPFVVAYDATGRGFGARLTAVLNGRGGVCRVRVEESGDGYSDDVVVRFYTHQWSLAERPVPETSAVRVPLEPAPTPTDPGPGPVWHPFAEPGSRNVDYYLTAKGRYSQYLVTPPPPPGAPAPPPPVPARVPVARLSVPFNLDTTATVRPAPPRVSHLLPAFRWHAVDGHGAAVDPADYFPARETGQLVLARKAAVRVYLRRPWHQTGAEQLGVVVLPAVANTTRTGGDLDPTDGGVVNRAGDYPNPGGWAGALDRDVIPPPLRELVSRWGFDPVWAEGPVPPLGAHHFPAALPRVAYETVSAGGVPPERLATLVLHEVRYDGAKNLWYADVAVDPADRGRPVGVYPFVRLNLVAYQAHAAAGLGSSEVVACDPFPLSPDRALTVRRVGWAEFELTLAGPFAAEPDDPAALPRRRVVAEVRPRDPSLPAEVEFLLKPGEAAVDRGPPAHEAVLAWDRAAAAYRGRVRLPDDPRGRAAAGGAVLAVFEKEYYRTVSPQPSATGDRAEVINGAACAARTVSSFAVRV